MKQISGYVGAFIAVAGLAFVARELARHVDDIRVALGTLPLATIPLSLLVGSLGMLTIGSGWRACLRLLGTDPPVLATLRSYYVGQLGKYVPGGIWPVVGRAEMARRQGIPGQTSYGSTLLSLGLTYLAAALTAVAGLFMTAAPVGAFPLVAVAILGVGISALHPRAIRIALDLLQRVSRRQVALPIPTWRRSVKLLLLHVPAWLAIGAATWILGVALDPGTPSFTNVLFATSLAWLIGFVAIPVPGGLGVREAVFVATATSFTTLGTASAVAVLARVVFIAVDLLGAGTTNLLTVGARRHATRSTEDL